MRIRGHAFKSFATALAKLEGDRAIDSMLARLPAAVAEAWRADRIASAAWYPVEWYVAVHRALDAATHKGIPLAYAIGRETARVDFGGALRFFSLTLAPHAIATRAPAAWALFYDAGQITVSGARQGHVVVEIEGCAGFDGRVWADITGASVGILEAAGAADVVARTLAGGGIAGHLRIELSWK